MSTETGSLQIMLQLENTLRELVRAVQYAEMAELKVYLEKAQAILAQFDEWRKV